MGGPYFLRFFYFFKYGVLKSENEISATVLKHSFITQVIKGFEFFAKISDACVLGTNYNTAPLSKLC